MRLPVKHVLPLAALIIVVAGGARGGNRADPPPPPPRTGPAADYPLVIGDPFTIAGVTHTPADKLNYDAVGHASIGEAGGNAVSAAHKVLPLPSYVEVTSLDSGKTILVRLERRGPMDNDHLIELSPGAAAQLGIAGVARAPVRVRRVNPPEVERAMLRSGNRAPERMETPKPLLAVLMRKLTAGEPLAPDARPGLASPGPAPRPGPMPIPAAKPAPKPTPPAAFSPKPAPTPAAAPAPKPAASGSFMVQAAAFSSEERAEAAAARLSATVSKPGRFWLMRLGPFATRGEAEAALAKAKAAGYSDARIQRTD
jgi:rare lipoprotein A